jgi:hypothetical protein
MHCKQIYPKTTPSEKQRQLDFRNNARRADFFKKTTPSKSNSVEVSKIMPIKQIL